jgi:hypothetical protein
MFINSLSKIFYLFIAFTFISTTSNAISAEKKNKSTKSKTKISEDVQTLPDDPTPFGFILGKTTSEEAKEIWDEEDGEIVTTGYGFANPTTEDDDPDGVLNQNVTLIDVQDLPMDNLESARFAFFKDTLFLIKYQLNGDKERMVLQLVAKYGEPNGTTEEYFSDDFHTWRFKNITLQLRQDFGKNELIFLHNKLAEDADESNKKLYAEFIRNKAKTERGF